MCPHCEKKFKIVDAVKKSGKPPNNKLYAKMVLLPGGQKQYRKITEEDIDAYKMSEMLLKKETPFIDKLNIEPGNNTNQVLNYCYTNWAQFFNARTATLRYWLAKAISDIENSSFRFAFSILFSVHQNLIICFVHSKAKEQGGRKAYVFPSYPKARKNADRGQCLGHRIKVPGNFPLFKTHLIRAIE